MKKGFLRNKKLNIITLIILIMFSLIIKKSFADVTFKSKIDYFNNFFSSQSNNLSEDEQKIVLKEFKDYASLTGMYLVLEDTSNGADIGYTVSSLTDDQKNTFKKIISEYGNPFIAYSLNKDKINFYNIKNSDIDRAEKYINDLSNDLSAKNNLSSLDQEFINKLLSIYDTSRSFFKDSNSLNNDNYINIYNLYKNKKGSYNYISFYGTGTNNSGGDLERIYSTLDGEASGNVVQGLILREWRVFLYNAINQLKSFYNNKNINKDILDYVGDRSQGHILQNIYDPKGIGFGNQSLTDDEISKNQATVEDVTIPVPIKTDASTGLSGLIVNPDTGDIKQDFTQVGKCPANLPFLRIFGSDIVSNTNCSVVAYLINKLLDVINSIFAAILNLAIGLFNWTIRFGIENFSNLVKGSGAYIIYQKIILALIVSLILPFVFYLILRALIDNDMDKIKKTLPRLLFTALFVYFSFTITGFLIDQSNVFTLKISSTLNNAGNLGDNISNLILRNTAGKDKGFTQAPDIPAPGEPTSIPIYLVQVLVTGSAIMVFFQAGVLIFSRAIILLLCLIFSPIMLLPEGIHSKIDEYRKKLTEYFTNNLLLAPIFMFLALIAIKIGQVGGSLVGDTLNGVQGWDGTFLAGAISGIISIIILMIAIAIAKKMSGEIGTKLSGKISSFTGNLAFGGTSRMLKGATNTLANSERFKGWVAEGTRTGRVANNLVNSLKGSTFDIRNNKTFQKASGGSFGRGTNQTAEDSYNRRYRKEKAYNDLLNEKGSERHLNRLKNGAFIGRQIARDLENGKNLNFNDSLKTGNRQNKSFDQANSETDKDKRLDKVTKEIDKHFKDNKKGDKYFSSELAKPENAVLLQKLKKANAETNESERKSEFLKVVKEFEDTIAKQKNNNSQINNPVANQTNNKQPIPLEAGQGGTQFIGPKPTEKDVEAQQKRKEELMAKRGGREQFEKDKIALEKNKVEAYQQKVLDDLKAKGPAPSTIRPDQLDSLKFKLKRNNEERLAQLSAKAFADALKTNLTPILTSIKNSKDNSNKNTGNKGKVTNINQSEKETA